jgi:(1->4)-alpha-D-glucan 1-alpha-D-glucosylmutase
MTWSITPGYSDVMGGRAGFERLTSAAHKRQMGIIVDVVPNHMAWPTPIYHNKAVWSVLKVWRPLP